MKTRSNKYLVNGFFRKLLSVTFIGIFISLNAQQTKNDSLKNIIASTEKGTFKIELL